MQKNSKVKPKKGVSRIPAPMLDFFDIVDLNEIKRQFIQDALDELNLSEREFVCMRYGLNDYQDEGIKTYQTLARHYRTSKDTVQRQDIVILAKLKTFVHGILRNNLKIGVL